MVRGVSNHQRTYENPPLTLAHDRVPQRRRVARPLDAQPRPRRRVERAGDAGLDQLALRGNGALIRVDEEDTHRARGYLGVA